MLAGLICVAASAGLAAWLFHASCFDPGPPVVRPEDGTPRAGFCSAVEATDPWLSLTIGPIAAFLLLAALLRRSRRWWIGFGGLAICIAVLSIGAISDALEYATTI